MVHHEVITLKLMIPKNITTYFCHLKFKNLKSMKSNKGVMHVPYPL